MEEEKKVTEELGTSIAQPNLKFDHKKELSGIIDNFLAPNYEESKKDSSDKKTLVIENSLPW